MIDLPDASTFAALFGDRRVLAAVAVSMLAGSVRGFSGFGSALIYVPLISAIFGPRMAAGTFLLIDFAAGIAMAPTVWPQANWREVTPLAVSAAIAVQFGALLLQYADPTVLRWMIVVVVTVLLLVLMSGWRYQGRPILPVTLGVGALAGTLGGAVQITGPPVIVYWLGSASTPRVVRANLASFFSLVSTVVLITYVARGLLTTESIALACLLGPVQILSIKSGTRLFHLASAPTYRRVAYMIVAMSALVSMPILDPFLR